MKAHRVWPAKQLFKTLLKSWQNSTSFHQTPLICLVFITEQDESLSNLASMQRNLLRDCLNVRKTVHQFHQKNFVVVICLVFITEQDESRSSLASRASFLN
ncbi:uncharacterized protein LOC120332952 [Styela clava]